MAKIEIELDLTNTEEHVRFNKGDYSSIILHKNSDNLNKQKDNIWLNHLIDIFKPKELEGYENFSTRKHSCGSLNNDGKCIYKAIVTCRKIKGVQK